MNVSLVRLPKILHTPRAAGVFALIALLMLTGCFNRQQAVNTNTSQENTNTATTTATTTPQENVAQPAKVNTAKPTNSNSNTNTVTPPAPQASSFTVALAARNDSQQAGTAVIINLGEGKTHVTLRLSNAPYNTPQPANIHTGTCASMGAVRHALNNVVNGISDTVLLIPYETLISQSPFSISIHQSSKEYGTYSACGEKI